MNKNDLFDRKWSAKIRVFNRNQKTSQDLQWTKKKSIPVHKSLQPMYINMKENATYRCQ